MKRGIAIRLLSSAVILLLVFQAQATEIPDIYGKIAGRVIDAATGTPLPGVNVFLAGTTQGTATDLDGNYNILRVKPGVYTVQASFIGFAQSLVEGVEVNVDQTSRVDFTLREEVYEGEEVVITAERGIVQVDRTTTTAVVNASQLESLPVTSIGDAINLQAGVVDGRFRGGRSGEVSYLVNGVPINNAFNNQAAFDVDQNMVASLEVISGVFNAEYGQAQSGVVNIVTKDVPSQWGGSFLGYVGTIASNQSADYLTRTTGPALNLSASQFSTEQVSFRDAADFNNLTDLQMSVGGPLIKERLGFQLTGRYLEDKGHYIGRNLFAPSDSSRGLNGGEDPSTWVIQSTGDGEFVPLSGSERFSLNATINASLTSTVKLEYNLFYQDGKTTPFSHDAKYVPTGLNRGYFGSQTHILSLRYTVGNRSFGNISYSYLRDKWDNYLYESPYDSRYQSSQLSGLTGTNAFRVGGNDLSTDDQLTETQTVVADFSSQLNNSHLMKVGLLARLHNLDNYSFGIEKSARTQFQPQPSPDKFADNRLKASPIELSLYAQDKMEFTGLIVNAGLRLDYFNADYDLPVDWRQGQLLYITDPDNPADSLYNRTPSKSEIQFSPRLGIAFPISSTGVMRFSAGLFFQIPSLSLLYTNPEYEISPQSSTATFGNAQLKPERTLSFEVGLQQGITSDMGLELTIFSKDVRNLTGQDIIRNPNGDFVVRWKNTDYGTIRGVTFSLFKQPGSTLSWTLDYTLQFAEGTSSDPGEAFGRRQSGLEEILSLVRLNWDRRHVFNNSITWEPSSALSVTVINRLRTGEPYTTLRGFVRSTLTNNADRPLQYWSDLRAYFKPPMIKQDLQLFLQIQNLFDSEVQYAVNASSGNAAESLEKELFRSSSTRIGGLNTLDEYFYHQEWYGPPRKVSIGLRLKF